jgi:hypothetical protein
VEFIRRKMYGNNVVQVRKNENIVRANVCVIGRNKF